MKPFRNLVVVFSVIAVVCAFSPLSFGHWGTHQKAKCEGDIKALRDSAAILQTGHADLAKNLTDLADQKETQMKKMQTMHEAALKTVDDASAALVSVNPDLSKGLKDYADMERKEMESGETPAMKEDMTGTIKLLKDSSDALLMSNPPLSEKLKILAGKKEMKMQWKEGNDESKNDMTEETGAPVANQ
jgi:hypothetical protein